MLLELQIDDLALIERAHLHFGAGFNAITGETGAGKSLLIDALELLLGQQRARASYVRTGAAQARVEGRFVLAAGGYGDRVAAWLSAHLPEALEDGRSADGSLELILVRTVADDGRSRAQVNHRSVTQRFLRELAAQLVEIHGQNDHQRLLDPAEQLLLLDSFGGLEALAEQYAKERAGWMQLRDRLRAQQAGEHSTLERLDLLRFQARELEEARPSVAERDGLAREREVLRHAEELERLAGTCLQNLEAAEGNALDLLRHSEHSLSSWEDRIPQLASACSRLRDSIAYAEEAAGDLRGFLGGIETDAGRLEEVESRLDLFQKLERKYRSDLAELERRAASVLEEIARLEEEAVDNDALAERVAEAAARVQASGESLRAARRKLRDTLRKAVEKSLAALGLVHARFDVSFRPREGEIAERFGVQGLEDIEFELAANPGESKAPLRAVASGGEIARIMLALRSALAVRQSTPTLIFDEIDSGVGGRLGPDLGAHLVLLGEHHQVVVVTHLPAVAAAAHWHCRVRKEVKSGRTRTLVERLDPAQRVEEVADMIAGGGEQETARAEARRLLGLDRHGRSAGAH